MSLGKDLSSINALSVKLERFPGLELVLDTPKGRGVFATQHIPAGTVIDTSPVIILDPEADVTHTQKTTLNHYTYNWPLRRRTTTAAVAEGSTETTSTQHAEKPKTITTQAVVLGLGSMFNHSRFHQNVGWRRDLERQVVVYRALRDVVEGEELCISYGDHLTFDDVEASQEEDFYHDSEPGDVLARIGSY